MQPSLSSSLRGRKQQLLLPRTTSTPSCGGSTAAEVCGGTTAECAAVWCCCPCGLVNLLVLAVYKVPAGLCRRALRNRRRRRLVKKGLLPPADCGMDSESAVHPFPFPDDEEEIIVEAGDEEAVVALEKEMWDRFYGAGFWRSPSQKDAVTPSPGMGLLRRLSNSKREAMASPRVSFTAGVCRSVSPTDAVSPRSLYQLFANE